MTEKHTRGPWVVDECPSAAGHETIRRGDATGSVDIGEQPIATAYQADDAARIVACVNACEGMDDPAAEIARLRGDRDGYRADAEGASETAIDTIRALQVDRDELRDALAEVIRAVNRPDLPEVQGAMLTLERTCWRLR